MKIYYSELHRRHNPSFEVFDGGEKVPFLENPERMDKILSALSKTRWAEITEPTDFGLGPILAVHTADYLNFLESAWEEWINEKKENGSYSKNLVLYPATFAVRRNPFRPDSILGRAGYHMMDLSAGIVEGTYKAVLASANCALSGAKSIADKSITDLVSSVQPPTAFALCRPPGHHAGKDYAAGYCYINNAAVAANWLSSMGRVALLDIDYHAGNGSQDIFYDRSDVLTISLHADPAFEYPYYAGYARERGQGAGINFHHNFPLPSGTDDSSYLATLEKALQIIVDYSPGYLVVSIGADIYKDDPLGKFNITHKGFWEIGRRIANLRYPTLLIMEGGYNNEALGENIIELLIPFASV
jgi:acetoin utilization deacetylase AcuC-like enzyme